MSISSPTRDALVVSICNYECLNDNQDGTSDHKKVSELNDLSEKARRFADLLGTQGRFRVTYLPSTNLNGRVTLLDLERAIKKLLFPPKESPTDTALLFFAGHGLIKKSWFGLSEEGFLATTEANGKSVYGMSLKRLRKLLRKSPVRKQVVLLESCYSGMFFDGFQDDRGHSYCLVTSARANEEALAKGLLVQALLESLDCKKRLEDRITSEMLAKYLQRIEEHNGGSQRFVQRIHGQEIVLCSVTALEEKQGNRVTGFLETLWRITYLLSVSGFVLFAVAIVLLSVSSFLEEKNETLTENKGSKIKNSPQHGNSEVSIVQQANVGSGSVVQLASRDGNIIIGDIIQGESKPSVLTPVRPFQVVVKATQDWQPTGFNVLKGEKISIKVVGGQWNAAAGFLSDNNGSGYGYSCAQSAIAKKVKKKRCSLEDYSLGALVASIGKTKYGIGNNCIFVVTDNGDVFLRMNDDNSIGKSGELVVELNRISTISVSNSKICGQPFADLEKSKPSKDKVPEPLF